MDFRRPITLGAVFDSTFQQSLDVHDKDPYSQQPLVNFFCNEDVLNEYGPLVSNMGKNTQCRCVFSLKGTMRQAGRDWKFNCPLCNRNLDGSKLEEIKAVYPGNYDFRMKLLAFWDSKAMLERLNSMDDTCSLIDVSLVTGTYDGHTENPKTAWDVSKLSRKNGSWAVLTQQRIASFLHSHVT